MTRRRRGGIKRGDSKLASNHFPMCSPHFASLRDVHRATQRRGGRRQRWLEGLRGGIKRRETDPASNQSPKCFHSLEHTKRFTELGREEKREGEIEAIWCRKRRVKRERELSGQ